MRHDLNTGTKKVFSSHSNHWTLMSACRRSAGRLRTCSCKIRLLCFVVFVGLVYNNFTFGWTSVPGH